MIHVSIARSILRLLFVSLTSPLSLGQLGELFCRSEGDQVVKMSAKDQMSKLLDQLMGQNRDGEFPSQTF